LHIQAQNHYLLQERHCKIIFVATATGTAHRKVILFYTCTQINKHIYKKIILTHLKRKWQINQVTTVSTILESMINEYPDRKDFEFP